MTVPAEIILRIVELTSVEPVWLLRGEGAKFREKSPSPSGTNPARASDGLSTSPITTLLRVALERLEEKERTQDQKVVSPIISRREKEGQDLPSTVEGDPEPSDEASDTPLEPGPGDVIQGGSLEGRRAYRSLRVADDTMAPIVAEGAQVAYGEPELISTAINEKLVVAWIDGTPVVRWFQHCGKFALLRAENPAASPPTMLVELERPGKAIHFHRVLWISTPH